MRVRNTFHFAYADGTPYFPIGTTCYAWTHQGDELEEQTLATLKAGPFNKMRMCVFPKWYAYNKTEPPLYPFAGTPPNRWDFTRFNPEFFRHLEQRVGQLRDLGIEADLILFHPYDEGHWGFDRMPAAADDRYLRYVVARLAAYRNVWWSLANEFDFMKEKTDADWDRFFQIVARGRPVPAPAARSTTARVSTTTTNPLGHARQHPERLGGRGLRPGGPVPRRVPQADRVRRGEVRGRHSSSAGATCRPRRWSTASGRARSPAPTSATARRTSTRRTSSGGPRAASLRGQSPARIAFLRKVLEDGPPTGIEPIDKWQDERTAGKSGRVLPGLLRQGEADRVGGRSAAGKTDKPLTLTAEVLDTWNMTVKPVPGTFTLKQKGRYRLAADPPATIQLPGTPYLAIRLRAEAPKK